MSQFETVIGSATVYHQAGYSTIPIAQDGSKRPAAQFLPVINGRASWAPYQTQRADAYTLERWFARGHNGIGVVCGAVSGGLAVLDCESLAAWEAIERDAHALGLGTLVESSSLAITPSGGAHLYCLLDHTVPGGTVLARDRDKDVLVETRAEGNYVLAPGCPAGCHATGKLYEWRRWVASPQRWGAEQWTRLLEIARSLNEWVAPTRTSTHAPASGATHRNVVEDHDGTIPPIVSPGRVNELPDDDATPGTAFNRRASWQDILTAHGWVLVGHRGETLLWRRPGKSDLGLSATTGHCRGPESGDMLYVFSSNAHPFEPDASYSKFAAYALLNHAGDYRAAASDLRAQGYGNQSHEFSLSLPVPNPIPGDATAPQTRRGYKLMSELQLIDPSVQWIVHGLIRQGANTLFSAHPKVGKTTFLSHLMRTMGTGGVFCGLNVQPTRILIVSEEDEQTIAARRDELNLGDHIGVYARPFKSRPNPRQWVEFLSQLRADCHEHGAQLVVLDTLSKLLPIKDENQATEVDSALQGLWALNEAGIATLVVHHLRKGDGTESTGARGSSTLTAHFEVLVEMRRLDPNDRTSTSRVLTCNSRFRESPDELVVSLDQGEYGAVGNRSQVALRAVEDQVLAALRAQPGMTTREIERAAGINFQVAATVLARLHESGQVIQEGDGRRGSPLVWIAV